MINMKKGISLITLIITIVVLIILCSVVIITLSNTGVIGKTKETKFKADLKSYDEEIRQTIGSEYTHDSSVVNRLIIKKADLEKYCKGLVESEHIRYSYISEGVLTLRRQSLIDIFGKKQADKMIAWAEEAKIKIDNGEEIIVSDSEILTKFSETEWTRNDVVLTILGLKDKSIKLHKKPYSFDNGLTWVDENSKTYEQNIDSIYIRVRDEYDYIYTNPEIVIDWIDKTSPTVPEEISVVQGLNTLTVMASGSTDTQSGMDGYKYSIDGYIWTDVVPENETYIFDKLQPNTNLTVYAKAVDNVGNESNGSKEIKTSTLEPNSNITITLSTEEWTRGPISATISCDNIPLNYVLQYKLSEDTNYTSSSIIPEIKKNTIIYARLYYDEATSEIASKEKEVKNIDIVIPSITNVTRNTEKWVNTSIMLTINGASDSQSGLNEKPYSFDNGQTWQAGNTKTYSTNTSNIIIKVKDKVGNIYTHSPVNINQIDKIAPTIASVSTNIANDANSSVTLVVNGASDTGGSELHSTSAYSFDNGATWQASNQKTFSTLNSSIIIKVRDNALNVYTHPAINVQPTVSIQTNPTSQTVTSGNKTNFKVVASGNGKLTYQWYYNTSNSNTGGTAVSGATTNTLSITASDSVNKRYYYCVVTSSVAGKTKSATSSTALLTVTSANYSITKSGVVTYYTRLAAAVGGASSGNTIVALKNVTDETYATINKNVTLNTNGKTITLATGYITVDGSNTVFNLNGSGKITTSTQTYVIYNKAGTSNLSSITLDNTSATSTTTIYCYGGKFTVAGSTIGGGEQSIFVDANGSGVINSGTVNNTIGYAIKNYGILEVNGGTISSTVQNTINSYKKLIVNGGTFTNSAPPNEDGAYHSSIRIAEGEGIINDAKVTSSQGHAITNKENSNLTIYKGTFEAARYCISNEGILNTNGGTFTSSQKDSFWNSGEAIINNGTYRGSTHTINNKNVLTINGGNIYNYVSPSSSGSYYNCIHNRDNAKTVINGGYIYSSQGIGVGTVGDYVEIEINGGEIIGERVALNCNEDTYSTKVRIYGGTLISNKNIAISLQSTSANLIIGSSGTTISRSSPCCLGYTYGVKCNGYFSFYNGVIGGVSGPNYYGVDSTRSGASIMRGTMTRNGVSYSTMCYN